MAGVNPSLVYWNNGAGSPNVPFLSATTGTDTLAAGETSKPIPVNNARQVVVTLQYDAAAANNLKIQFSETSDFAAYEEVYNSAKPSAGTEVSFSNPGPMVGFVRVVNSTDKNAKAFFQNLLG